MVQDEYVEQVKLPDEDFPLRQEIRDTKGVRLDFDIKNGSLVESPPRADKKSMIQERLKKAVASDRLIPSPFPSNTFNIIPQPPLRASRAPRRFRNSRPPESTSSNQRCRSVWVITSFNLKSSDGDRIPVQPETLDPTPSKLSLARLESRLRRQSLD